MKYIHMSVAKRIRYEVKRAEWKKMKNEETS